MTSMHRGIYYRASYDCRGYHLPMMQAAILHKQASYYTHNKHKARCRPIKINNINKQAARLFKEGNSAIIYLLLNNGEPIPNKMEKTCVIFKA